jgi:Cu(I)/Ag(I) efflux system membrane fusion protein
MNKTNIITALIMLGIGIGVGFWFSQSSMQSETATSEERKPLYYRSPMDPGITSRVPAKGPMGMDYIPVYAERETPIEAKKILFYRNPMNPDITSPVPAKDSMGMDYVPVYADGGSSSDIVGTVQIDPVVVQNMGVRTQFALKKTFGRAIRAVGRVDFDEQKMARLHPKVEGWIEEIMVDKTGQSVDEDDILLGIYSPKLVSTQQEYLLALNNLSVLQDSPIDEIKQGAQQLVNSARERLQLFDVPEHQIKELEESRKIKKTLHIHTPVAGTVISIGSRQGQYVTPKTELFMIVDLSQVWVYADIYEYELPWIKEGDEVEMTLASVPGRTFKGSLAYIYPYAESKTRTTKVRLVFDNPDRLLRPDMFAEVIIQSDTLENAIVIPSEAVIRSGDHTQVFVKRGPGKFEPRLVKLGVESGGEVAVLQGVNAGEEVVTSAQFLVDSESKLKEATAKMMEMLNAEDSGQSTPVVDQSKMKMDDTDHNTQKGDSGMDMPDGQPEDSMTNQGSYNND